jgi:hypothetical protein
MQLQVITAPQRRMLLEMLASERSGEDALYVGAYFGRDQVADSLCDIEMSAWVGPEELVFTHLGRYIAESLASRLLATPLPALHVS